MTTVKFFPKAPGQKRHYEINGLTEIDGLPIVSVTEILKDIGDKFGVAAWWGMKVGVEGSLKLHRLGIADLNKQGAREVVPLLTENKLTVNHVRDAAGDRGTSVHAAAEQWARGEVVGPTIDFPENEQPYIAAFKKFVVDKDPRPLDSEVLVGSRSQAYAGTYDLEATIGSTVCLIDFKTKSSPPKGKPKAYEQHHLQLTAYEMARVEMGMDPTGFQAVVNLYPDGSYALIENRSTFHQWLGCLQAYRALSDLRAAIKEAA